VTAEPAHGQGPEPIRTAPFGLMDGLALMLTEPNESLLREARRCGLPLVTLDADLGAEGVDSILIDNTTGAAEAIAHPLG
jgi:DNA-binding LacI/PurR family transcriptional regulator